MNPMVKASHYKPILDSLLTAAIVLDQNLNLSCVNASAEALLGFSEEQMLSKHVSNCFTDLDNRLETLTEALLSNHQFTVRQAQWRLHNNQIITVDYSVIPNPDLGFIVIEAHPLDRLLRISREESMLSTQETSRNLIRSMAHEIKNPLGGIRGAAQLLSKELNRNGLDDFEEYTQVIIGETDRLRNLVDRMLGPSKLLTPKPINIHLVLEHISTIIKAETGNDVEIKRDYDPSIPDTPGDKERLIQATLNIARNAVQALQERPDNTDGCITFKTRIQRRFTIGRIQHPLVARISIIDNGPGIPDDLIQSIFFPMITGRPEGTGLGLAIAQNLISQHRGTVECKSSPGHTEFSIYLPLDDHYAKA